MKKTRKTKAQAMMNHHRMKVGHQKGAAPKKVDLMKTWKNFQMKLKESSRTTKMQQAHHDFSIEAAKH